MKKLLTILLVLCTLTSSAQMRGGSQYDPGAARTNLNNVDAAATPSITSITLSDKIRAVWADILGDIYASGTVKVATGTAAAPAYTFSSDPDTGLFSGGANTLGFGVNGAESGRIIENYLLFGTTSTDPFLGTNSNGILLYSAGDSGYQVSGTGAWFDALSTSASVYGGLRIYDANKVFQAGVYCAGNNDLLLLASGTERLRVVSNGNVLIATSTDDGANKLQVNGFTKLGEAATGIKMKVLTGTTAAAEGGDVTVNHGLASPDKIIDYSILVWIDADTAVPVNCGTEDAGYACYSYIDATAIKVKLHSTDSENILSKAFVITLWYKE